MKPKTLTSIAVRGTRTRNGVTHTVEYPSIYDVRLGGFSPWAVRQAVRGRQKHHAGYEWKPLSPMPVTVPKRTHEVAELRNAGRTDEEIAKLLGITLGHAKCRASRAVAMGLTKKFAEVQRDIANRQG